MSIVRWFERAFCTVVFFVAFSVRTNIIPSLRSSLHYVPRDKVTRGSTNSGREDPLSQSKKRCAKVKGRASNVP
jgi:hypothetical protein